MPVQSIKQMQVYVKAYELALQIFELTKRFPVEERYALTSQIRRSSRSVCLNLREAWAKRRFEAHFVSKLTDCDAEINETDTALDFARDCGYVGATVHAQLIAECNEVRKMLGAMILKPAPFLLTD